MPMSLRAWQNKSTARRAGHGGCYGSGKGRLETKRLARSPAPARHARAAGLHLRAAAGSGAAWWNDPAMVERTRALMARAGQEPIRLRREFQGFAANRSQAALIGAALRMVRTASPRPPTSTSRSGTASALRWSFMGPLETIDLDAPAASPITAALRPAL